MIRKYVICAKDHVYIQGKTTETISEIGRVVELILPIRELWNLEKEVKEIRYLSSNRESNVDFASTYKRLLRLIAPYAVREEDRLWLYEHSKD